MTEAYRELVNTFGRGWERGAVDEITSVFAPEAVFLENPFSSQRVGLDQIRDYWKDVPANQADTTFKAGEMYVAGPWFATEFRCTYRRRRTGEWVDARGAIFCETKDGKLTHGVYKAAKGGVAHRAVPHGDVSVLESGLYDRLGPFERLGLHPLADVDHHLAPRALQCREVLEGGLSASHDSGDRLRGVGDAGDGIEELAHGKHSR